ncbi:MAG: hypothetical protein LBL65_06900 [Campylobacteraceae bacterium]|nr:hypothetical protein [Campylobacteraceae bacterium]
MKRLNRDILYQFVIHVELSMKNETQYHIFDGGDLVILSNYATKKSPPISI